MVLGPEAALPLSVDIMDSLDFSEEEIREQLEILGYKNINKEKLREFKRDLDKLIRHEKTKSQASSSDVPSPQSATSQSSPPAYTKEKVSQYYIRGPGEGHLLQAGVPNYQTQVLTSHLNRGNGTRQDYDSYAKHSVSPKYPHLGPPRLLVEPTEPDTQSLSHTVGDTTTSDMGTERRHFIKRKVLRKHNGQVLVCDESIHSEDSDAAVSVLEERLGGLHVSMSVQQDSEPEDEDISSQSDRQSSEDDRLSSGAFDSYASSMTRGQSERDFRPKPKSFIRPVLDHPHTRNLKKHDPVARYFQYKQEWDMFKAPGERDRRALHWEIREQLAYQPPPPKPRKVFVPNTYIVPTEKKRSALRWAIRNDLANGLPPRLNDRF